MSNNTHSTDPSPDNIPLAIGAVVFTVFALSLGDAFIKQLSSGFVLWQIFVLRSLLALPVLVIALMFFVRDGSLIPKQPVWTSLRSLMLVTMWIAYYVSLPHLQLSVAAAAYYTLPLFITVFSAILAGEKVRKTGWIAVIMGFLGVLLILRPAAEDFNAYALLPLLSAMLFALSMILTRTKCRSEHPLTLSLGLNVFFVVIGGGAAMAISLLPDEARLGFLLANWAPMGADQWTAMALLSVAILIGSIGAAIAYQNAPSSIVGTYDFAYVGFATLWGLMLFEEVPDLASVAGMSLIVAAGVLSLRR